MNESKHKNSSVAAIILAAGASKRMGQPKQLLPYRAETLLTYVTKCALVSSCSLVAVVLGANLDKIEPTLKLLPVKTIKNLEWNEGIASSIRLAIKYIKESFPHIDRVIFLTCDQPFISTETIEQLINTYNSNNRNIVASKYGGTIGIPALFSRSFFPELMQLRGDRGAKKIIKKYYQQVISIDFPQGKIDLDTLADYQKLTGDRMSFFE